MRNLIVICLDALSKEYMGCYPHFKRNSTTFINKIAEKSIVFNDVITNGTETRLSVPSYLGSVYPLASYTPLHLLYNVLGNSGEVMYAPEFFKTNGFKTLFINNNSYICGYDYGFSKDEIIYVDPGEFLAKENHAGQYVVDCLKGNFVKKFLTDSPFFMYIHLLNPHGPHTTDPKKVDQGYSGSVEYADDIFRQIFEILGQIKDTVIVIMSDHGEEDYTNGYGGHGGFWETVIRVPLIMWEDSIIAQGIGRSRSLIDLFPDIIDMFYPELISKIPLNWMGNRFSKNIPADYRFIIQSSGNQSSSYPVSICLYDKNNKTKFIETPCGSKWNSGDKSNCQPGVYWRYVFGDNYHESIISVDSDMDYLIHIRNLRDNFDFGKDDEKSDIPEDYTESISPRLKDLGYID